MRGPRAQEEPPPPTSVAPPACLPWRSLVLLGNTVRLSSQHLDGGDQPGVPLRTGRDGI